MENKLGQGFSGNAYAELPVPAAFMTFIRGDAKLAAIVKDDPAAYLGGWRAFIKAQDGSELPKLPLPIVTRTSEDGSAQYQVYARNYVSFVVIQHRTRFELRQKVKDEQTGKEYDRVVNISQTRRDGYKPYRQVFGLLYSPDGKEHAPAVLKFFNWSSFISAEKADRSWDKVMKSTPAPAGQILVRRFGTVGKKTTVDGKEMISPVFETYGQARLTPIEAVGLDKPTFVPITDEMNTLFTDSMEWKNCPKWNAEGEIDSDDTASPKSLFIKKANEMGISNIEIEQLSKEAKYDYSKALQLLEPPADVQPEDNNFGENPY